MSHPLETLQFQKAEIALPDCNVCSAALENEYFRVGQARVCPACASHLHDQPASPAASALLRAALYGLAAALGGALLYAVILLVTGIEIGLMAILVGYVVGRAVRKGSGGIGGRRCQILAVALTYVSISLGYIPVLIKGAVENQKQEQEKQAKAAGKKAEPGIAEPGKDGQGQELTLERPSLAAAVAVMILLGLAVPFLQLAQGLQGILGILIVLIGLQQAWTQTAARTAIPEGPFYLKEDAA